jgi:hypothetical protein
MVLGTAMNRWRQRNAVLRATFNRLAACVMVIPSRNTSACTIHFDFWRRRASGVPVRALKVRPQIRHL